MTLIWNFILENRYRLLECTAPDW